MQRYVIKTGLMMLATLLTGVSHADYSLPAVHARLVMLVGAADARIDKRGLVLPAGDGEQAFMIDTFWMQDRIWSDGICVGVRDRSPKSAVSRVDEIRKVLRKKKGQVLVELVQSAGSDRFIVSYMKVFDLKTEFSRYAGKQVGYDMISMPFPTKLENAEQFQQALERVSRAAATRLRGMLAKRALQGAALSAMLGEKDSVVTLTPLGKKPAKVEMLTSRIDGLLMGPAVPESITLSFLHFPDASRLQLNSAYLCVIRHGSGTGYSLVRSDMLNGKADDALYNCYWPAGSERASQLSETLKAASQ